MRVSRTVTIDKPLDKVFGYLSDFTTTTQWDPGTVETIRLAGNGGVGTRYLNTSTFAGRRSQVTYVVQEVVPNQRISLRGENKTVIANDTITFRETTSGAPSPEMAIRTTDGTDATDGTDGTDGTGSTRATEVTYTADFTFKGVARLVAPLLRPAFARLGNDAERGMSAALARL